MIPPELSSALYGILIALCGVATAVISVVAYHAPRYVKTLLELKTAQLEGERGRALITAADAGVAAAAEAGETHLAHDPERGKAKLEIARATATAIAPRAVASLKGERALTDVVQASVAKRRASLPNPSMYPPPLAPPTGPMLSIPVQVLGADSISPTNPPPASAEGGEEEPGNSPRPPQHATFPKPARTPEDLASLGARYRAPEPSRSTTPGTPGAKRSPP